MVRALRVKEYGEPYSATANLTVNGDQVYIDTQMTREGNEFTRNDFNTFYEFCRQLDMKAVNFDKIKNGKRLTRQVDIIENQETKTEIRLVK